VSFFYKLANAGVPTILAIQETRVGPADPASNFQFDRTITIFVSEPAVGNPQQFNARGVEQWIVSDIEPRARQRAHR
jgi:hypothetical protein